MLTWIEEVKRRHFKDDDEFYSWSKKNGLLKLNRIGMPVRNVSATLGALMKLEIEVVNK